MTRLFMIIAAIGAVAVGAMQLSAQVGKAGWQTYDEAEFMMAQKKGKAIVAHVYAENCPTCRAQAPVLDQLRKERQSADVLFVKVDYDTQKAFLRAHHIPHQSTVLVFEGMDETARSIAETDRTRLRRAVLEAL